MTVYKAPLEDIRFLLEHVLHMDKIASLPGYEQASPDMVEAILSEADRFFSEVVAPTNHSADKEGLHSARGSVWRGHPRRPDVPSPPRYALSQQCSDRAPAGIGLVRRSGSPGACRWTHRSIPGVRPGGGCTAMGDLSVWPMGLPRRLPETATPGPGPLTSP